MFAKGQTVIQWMEGFAPKYIAVPDDRIGLQLGTLQKEIKKAMIALDVTDAVVTEAIDSGVDLIIAHHAIIFRPLAHLQTDTPAGKLYERLIKHDIAVYISHTNLDTADGGVNDMLADALGLMDRKALSTIYTEKNKKLVVFVPETHEDVVQKAIFAAGAGEFDQYSECAFRVKGTGTFRPRAGSNPYIGSVDESESVSEVRIETIFPEHLERKIVQAMIKSHPYEEAAYDIYTMDRDSRSFGLGRVGYLSEPLSLAELAEKVKMAFQLPCVRVVGSLDCSIRKAAVLGGAGSRYTRHAQFAGADVLITGDIDYHTAHDALAAGLCIIDAGHHIESILKDKLAARLQHLASEKKVETQFIASKLSTEVFQFI